MPIDASIPLQVQRPRFASPMEQMMQSEQLAGLAASREYRMLQMAELQRDAADTAMYRQIVQQAGGDPGQAAQQLRRAGLVKQADAMEKSATDRLQADATLRKTEGEIAAQGPARRKVELEQAMQMMGAVGQIMSGVRDQATYTAARQQIGQMLGPQAMANVPELYDPAVVESNRQRSLSVAQQLEQEHRVLTRTETGRHNRQTEAAAWVTANKPSPGQFLMAPDGTTYLGDPRTGAVRPSTFVGPGAAPQGAAPMMPGPGGVLQAPAAPIAPPGSAPGTAPGAMPSGPAAPVPGAPFKQAAPKNDASEDERRAAGWFQQAQTAMDNMQRALAENPDAARPGLGEALARGARLPDTVVNSQLSPARQRFVHAVESMSEAVLRAATGAGVNIQEAQQKVRELAPVYGEDASLTRQKMDGMRMYLQALQSRAGRALPPGSATAAAAPSNDPLGIFGGRR